MYRTTYLLLSMSLLFGTSYGMYNPILPVFVTDELGATYEDLGVIGMVTFIPYVLVPLLIGIGLDKVNSRYLLTAGFTIHAVSIYMTAIATTLEEIILYRVMSGFAHALVWPPAIHTVAHDPDTRVKHMAMFTMCFVVGYMVGPLVGSFILDVVQTDYRTLLLVSAFVMGVGVMSILLNYPHHQVQGGRIDLLLFKEILKFPTLVIILLYSTVVFGLVLAIYPAFLHESALDGPAILQLYAIFGVTRILAFLLVRYLSKYMKWTFMLSTGCVAAAMAISAVGTTFMELAVAMLLLGFGFASIYPLGLDVILSGSKKIASGRLVGAYETLFGIGWILGPLAGGYAMHSLGSTSLYWALFAAGLGCLLLAFLFRNKMIVTITVVKYDPESRKARTIFVKQALKNNFAIVLMSAGMMNNILKNVETYEAVPVSTLDMYRGMLLSVASAGETLSRYEDLLDTELAGKIRSLLSKMEAINPASGVGSGYPDYDDIKKRVEYCTNRLDRTSDDAIFK